MINQFVVDRVTREYAQLSGRELSDARKIVGSWLLYDWDNQQEHLEWANTAPYKEIAEWVHAGQSQIEEELS